MLCKFDKLENWIMKVNKLKIAKIVSTITITVTAIVPTTAVLTLKKHSVANNQIDNVSTLSDTQTILHPSLFYRNYQLDDSLNFKGINNQLSYKSLPAGLPVSESFGNNPGIWLNNKLVYVTSPTTVSVYDINTLKLTKTYDLTEGIDSLNVSKIRIEDIASNGSKIAILCSFNAGDSNYSYNVKFIDLSTGTQSTLKKWTNLESWVINNWASSSQNQHYSLIYPANDYVVVNSMDSTKISSTFCSTKTNEVNEFQWLANSEPNKEFTNKNIFSIDSGDNKFLLFTPFFDSQTQKMQLQLSLSNTINPSVNGEANQISFDKKDIEPSNNDITIQKFIPVKNFSTNTSLFATSSSKINYLGFNGVVLEKNYWKLSFTHASIENTPSVSIDSNTDSNVQVNNVLVDLKLPEESLPDSANFNQDLSISFSNNKILATYSEKGTSSNPKVLEIALNQNLDLSEGSIGQITYPTIPTSIQGSNFYPIFDKIGEKLDLIIDQRGTDSNNSKAWVMKKSNDNFVFDYQTEIINQAELALVVKSISGLNDIKDLQIEVVSKSDHNKKLNVSEILYNPIFNSQFQFKNITNSNGNITADLWVSKDAKPNFDTVQEGLELANSLPVEFELSDEVLTNSGIKYGTTVNAKSDEFNAIFTPGISTGQFPEIFNYKQIWEIKSELEKVNEAVKKYLTDNISDFIVSTSKLVIPTIKSIEIVKDSSDTLGKLWNVNVTVDAIFDSSNVLKTYKFDGIIKFNLESLNVDDYLVNTAINEVISYDSKKFSQIFGSKAQDYKYQKVWDTAPSSITDDIYNLVKKYFDENISYYIKPLQGADIKIVSFTRKGSLFEVKFKFVLASNPNIDIMGSGSTTNFEAPRFKLETINPDHPTTDVCGSLVKATSKDFSKYFSDQNLKFAENWVNPGTNIVKPEIKELVRKYIESHFSEFFNIPEGLTIEITPNTNFDIVRRSSNKADPNYYVFDIKNLSYDFYRIIGDSKIIMYSNNIPEFMTFMLSPTKEEFAKEVNGFIKEAKQELNNKDPLSWFKKAIIKTLSNQKYLSLFPNGTLALSDSIINISENDFQYKNPYMDASNLTFKYNDVTSDPINLELKYISATILKHNKIKLSVDEFKKILPDQTSVFSLDWVQLYNSPNKRIELLDDYYKSISGNNITELVYFPYYDTDKKTILTNLSPFSKTNNGSLINTPSQKTNNLFIDAKLVNFVNLDDGTPTNEYLSHYFEFDLKKSPTPIEIKKEIADKLYNKFKNPTPWDSQEAIKYIYDILNSFTPNPPANSGTINPNNFKIPYLYIPNVGKGQFSAENTQIDLKTNEFKYWMDIKITPTNNSSRIPEMQFHLDLTAKQLGIDETAWWKIALYIITGLIAIALIVLFVSLISKINKKRIMSKSKEKGQTFIDPLDEEL